MDDNETSASNETLDDVIEQFESKLNDLYEKKEENVSQPVFNVAVPEIPEVKREVVTSEPEVQTVTMPSETRSLDPKDYLWLLYIVLPLVFSGLLYYFKPKQVLKGTKIDRFKFLRVAFLITVVVWIGVFCYLNYV